MNSCVYFLVFHEVELIKVGYSSSIIQRYRNLMSAYGAASEHSIILRCDEERAKAIEREVFKHFAFARVPPKQVKGKIRGSLSSKAITECFDLKLRRQLEDYALEKRLGNPHTEISNLGALFIEERGIDSETIFEMKDSIKEASRHLSKYRRVSNHTKPYW